MSELPPGWQACTLNDVASLVRNGIFARRPTDDPGGVPILRISAVRAGKLDLTARKYVTGLDAATTSKYAIHPGDLLFTRYNGSRDLVGRCARVPDHDGLIVHPDKLIRVVPRGNVVDSRFLALLTETQEVRRFIEPRIKTTAGQSGVTGKDIREIPVCYPRLAEQRWIVDILEDQLSCLDSGGRAILDAMNRRRLLRASVLHSLSTGPTVSLGELSIDAGYGTSTKCDYDGPGVPVVRIPNLVDGKVDLGDQKRALDENVDLSGLMLSEGDLLIVRTNGSRDLIGRSAVVQPNVVAAFASYLIRFKIDRSRARPEWVRLMLEAPRTRRVLEGMAASSAGQYNLGLKKLNTVEVPCPSIPEQDRLLAEAAAFDWRSRSVAQYVEQARQRSTALRQALLDAAFSGRLMGRASDMNLVEEMAGV